MTSHAEMRSEALDQAILASDGAVEPTATIIDRAAKFYDFVQGSAQVAAGPPPTYTTIGADVHRGGQHVYSIGPFNDGNYQRRTRAAELLAKALNESS
jgi:hypothetical protein